MNAPPTPIPPANRIQRRPLVAALLASRRDALVVPGLGSTTWDCHAAGDRPEFLYSWGAMGLAVPTALGVALAQPERRVLALTGDGEMMMGIGALGVVAAEAPTNLAILVLDNESFGETGRQDGLTGGAADLCEIASGFGIARTLAFASSDALGDLQRFLFEEPGPVFASVKIALDEDAKSLPIRDGAAIARRFRAALGLERL